MKVKLKPELIKNGKLIMSSKENSLLTEQTYIALSFHSSKKYSFVVKIDDIEINSEINENILIANKNLTGLLGENDLVELYPYNVPRAKEMIFIISDEYRTITPGDWTASIKDIIVNNIYDLGDDLKIPLELAGKILILRGKLIESTPQAPVQCDTTTKVILKKDTKDIIDDQLSLIEKQKIERTDVLSKAIFDDLINNIQRVKLENKILSLDLNLKGINARIFDEAIIGLFDSYNLFKEELIDDTKSKFVISRDFVYQKDNIPQEVISYRLTTTKDHGTLLIECKALDNDKADTLLNSFKNSILNIHMGFKESYSKKEKHRYIQTFILEKGEQLQKERKSKLSLAQLVQDLQVNYPNWDINLKHLRKILKKMEKNGLIAELEELESGFLMIEFHPLDLTTDPIQVLRFGQEVGIISKEKLLTHFGWDDYRMQGALDFLVQRKLIKEHSTYREGTKYFFKSS